MDDIKVDIVRAEYHRNGIGGEGFYAAVIHCDGETLLATISYKDDGETFDSCSCRVTDALDLSEHYRGDVIGDALIPKLKAYLEPADEVGRLVAGTHAVDPDEKNITKKFGCYSAELNVEREGGDLVSWCHVSCTRRGVDYCSSLALLEHEGTIEAESGEVVQVPEAMVARIHRWADANGY